jgi:acyl-CoA synthetase (AMP-forming)/AMP-acid ligase II/acyl carrier protein
MARGLTGERALLLYPPGLEFIAAFFGCLYAGVVAVPAYPPDFDRLAATLPRLGAIARDSSAAIVLGPHAWQTARAALGALTPELTRLPWLATDRIAASLAERYAPLAALPELAFLQYTSGTTGSGTAAPNGVQVGHDNLWHNQRLLQQVAGHEAGLVAVSWLPLFHDMGLIGHVLHPLFLGGRSQAILMSPVAFLQRPVRWLQAISTFRGETATAPNFGYELCNRKITAEDCTGLDLSSWRRAMCGAEPVRADTVARFCQRFAAFGFAPEAFYPTYGLAEATLFVTGPKPASGAALVHVEPSALARDAVVFCDAGAADGQTHVACGHTGPLHEVVIVHPQHRTLAANDRVGEICVAGPSVTRGYWPNRSHTFTLPERGDTPFLATGDLGFMSPQGLVVTGRKKELVIVRGRNYYPQDIEAIVVRAHPDVRPGGVAAFGIVRQADGEGLVVLAELVAEAQDRAARVLDEVRQALRQVLEPELTAVMLLAARSLPKTSSGKLQRRLCRAQYQKGELVPLAAWHAPRDTVVATPLAAQVLGLAPQAQRAALCEFIGHKLKALAYLPQDTPLPASQPFVAALGLDSLALSELWFELERALGRPLGQASDAKGLTIEAVADLALAALRDRDPHTSR